MTLATGQIIQQRYRIAASLGGGGFGSVYRAWDQSLNKPVAIKENCDTSLDAQRQFQREAQILSNLNHPNLPRVTDYFFVPGLGQFLVMDYVEGEDLQEMLNRLGQPLTEDYVLPWLCQVCDALTYLHTQNQPVIHRDVKPANIKITPQGKAVLVDFGISKVYDPQLKTTLGARAVTPGYSPVEQYGQGSTDARSDVYALGATLYVLLTGQEPQESVQRAWDDHLQAVHRVNPQIPAVVGEAIQRALAVNPTGRYQTAGEFKDMLVKAAQTARDERITELYRQATVAANHNDFAAAEAHLQQLLVLEPQHGLALALLHQINQRQGVQQRYQALSLTVAQARTEAAAIKQTDPNAADPDGVLRLLSNPVSTPVQSVASARPAAVQDSRRLQKLSIAIVVAAVLIGVIGLALAQDAVAKVLDTTASRELALGDLVIGVGLGLQVVALIVLNAASHRSSLFVAGTSVVVAAATLIALLGLSMATAAVFSVEKSLASANLGLGNFLMGLGIGAGVSGVVLYFVARKTSIP